LVGMGLFRVGGCRFGSWSDVTVVVEEFADAIAGVGRMDRVLPLSQAVSMVRSGSSRMPVTVPRAPGWRLV